MIAANSTQKIYLCCGVTDMRRGIDGLSVMVQEVLKRSPHSGAVFCFRGRKGHIIKVLSYDGQGFALFTKRLDRGHFPWPWTKEQVAISLTSAQLSMLLEGIDWRRPERTWRPSLAG